MHEISRNIATNNQIDGLECRCTACLRTRTSITDALASKTKTRNAPMHDATNGALNNSIVATRPKGVPPCGGCKPRAETTQTCLTVRTGRKWPPERSPDTLDAPIADKDRWSQSEPAQGCEAGYWRHNQHAHTC